MSTSQNKLKNVLTVLIGAILMGFLWRTRGTTGWGSSWGLLNAGAVFMLFVIMIVGGRKKTNLKWVGVSSLLFMLTVPTWGTFLSQITGVLRDSVTDQFVYISPASGVIVMLILGFGLATLWGIMLGRGLSDKPWKLMDFVLLIAVFIASMYASRATLAHTLTEIIQPEAVDLFEQGLLKEGITDTAYKAYMSHFDNMSWGKKITGGRNYFALVETISIAIGGIVSMIITRFAIKDKIASKMGLITASAFAFSITAADLFFFFGNGGYHMNSGLSVPDYIAPWSCWEYFTGFIAGGIITAAILHYKSKCDDVDEIAFSGIPEKFSNVLTFLLGFAVVFGINVVRPIIERFDESKYMILAIAIAFVGIVALIVIGVKKYGVNLERTTQTAFASKALPFMVIYIIMVYLFTGLAEGNQNYTSLNMFHNILMIVSTVILVIYSAVQIKKNTKELK